MLDSIEDNGGEGGEICHGENVLFIYIRDYGIDMGHQTKHNTNDLKTLPHL